MTDVTRPDPDVPPLANWMRGYAAALRIVALGREDEQCAHLGSLFVDLREVADELLARWGATEEAS